MTHKNQGFLLLFLFNSWCKNHLHYPVMSGGIIKSVFYNRSLRLPSSCVSEESLSSVGMSSLSLKSSEGEGTGPPGPLVSFFSSTTSGTASSSPSGRQSAYSSAGRSNWREEDRHQSHRQCFPVKGSRTEVPEVV